MMPYVEELKDNKYEVHFEDNVGSAVATIEDPAQQFDLLVLDISMPPGDAFKSADTRGGMRTGLPLYDKIRRLRPDLKIVVLTNVIERGVKERFALEDRRLCRFVSKPDALPFKFAELVGKFLKEA
jgi:CheY-like chemotaxis protein